MAVVRKRQDDANLKILRELVTSGGGNRQCFDCGQKGPTYVNMTIGSFVCTRCSGVLRGLTPPHRVKSISVAIFTPEELEFLKAHGNDVCAKTWLGLWDPKRIVHQDQRELMIDKYERKRYYLEPASPLKSLTNATKVSSLSSSNNSISTSGSGSNNINNNNNNISNNSSSKSSTDNSFKNVAITPPSSLRLTANGIVNSSTNSNRQNRYNFKNDDNSNKSSPLINGIGSTKNQFSNKNSLNISTNSNNSSQSFTPDSEFIADFSSANIFNATTQSTPNGFKNHHNIGNNITNGLQAKNYINGGASTNHFGLPNVSNVNENFADFDHAPIYNAAAAYHNSTCNNHFNNSNSNYNYFSTSLSNNTINNAVHSYSNSFDSPIIINNYSDSSSTSNNNNNSINTSTGGISASLNNLQWNVWQQFQWPSFTSSSSTNIESNHQNRWSLPMSNYTSNSLSSSSSAPNNSNSSINSTPPADRYAALKDLDEQLREGKSTVATTNAAVVDTFSSNAQTQPSTVNPFKANPPTLQPQPQQQAMNPFQTTYNNNNNNQTNSFFGTQPQQNNNTTATTSASTNTFGTNAGFNVQPISNFNGFSTTNQSTMITNGSNGCGLGYGNQSITAGNAASNMKNPFAASSLNSNNPFL